VSQFDKCKEALLRDVPEAISETVSRTIQASMNTYKALYPEADTSVESCPTGIDTSSSLISNGIAPDRTQPHPPSPMPPPLPRYGGEQEEVPRSPHERDKEFTGLFTPRYLPLLDSTSRNERRSSTPSEAPMLPKIDLKGKQKEGDTPGVDAGTNTRSLTNSPEVTRPPLPKRRNTDEVSIRSDWSDGVVRRSALRRSSSSSNRNSPRRVRFDVEGEEVLPTSSPVTARSPLSMDSPGISSIQEMEGETGLEQIEDVDEGPLPRRLSSSERLKALSRSPLADDGTQWTTVTAPPDGSASVATSNGFTTDSSSESLHIDGFELFSPATPRAIPIVNMGNDMSNESNGDYLAKGEQLKEEAETPSDDEMLDMPLLRRQSQSAASMLSPAMPADIEDNRSPTASTRSTGALWKDIQTLGDRHEKPYEDDLIFDDDQNAMFDFDENVPPKRPVPQIEDEASSESEQELLIKPKKSASQPSSFSRSPAREIIRTSPPRHVVPTSAGIVGSYKGHPFSMPIVSPEVHDQAIAMGNLNSFVGSVDGRSGIDEGDLQSFNRSGGIGSFSGTPRSMSERMMMDDIMEAEEHRRRRNDY